MDYFSRQLTIILNRLRTGVRSDLQKIDGSIRADTAAQHAPKDYGVDTPILVNVLRTPEAAANEKDAKEARQSREERDRKRLRIETWALFIGATVAVANVALWIQTREATRIAAISASAAQKGAAAAASQAEATKASIDATVANFRLEQRAWVGPDSMPSAASSFPIKMPSLLLLPRTRAGHQLWKPKPNTLWTYLQPELRPKSAMSHMDIRASVPFGRGRLPL